MTVLDNKTVGGLNKDFKVYLDDMINAINEVEKSTKDVSFEAFSRNHDAIRLSTKFKQ
jgi:uncharacterized protein with HEPN domain